ncbi:hypothetical protein C8R43DRAFT_1131018 [Mycena crocata]|nr:hypothetical protein C8R43DRAFT_1131018 [Mycena crocata]
MPGRHVRFSAENSFHSSSASGPFQPPTHHANPPGTTQYAPCRPYPGASLANGRVHQLLASSDAPMLNYDFSMDPSLISTNYRGAASPHFLEPAVYPLTLTISIVMPHLPWAITVSASNAHYITVSDVLNTLHFSPRVNITPDEFCALGSHKLMRRVTAAYVHRYTRLQSRRGYAEEKRQGVKRVDFLMGYTKFRGLSATMAPDTWRLHVL